MNRFESGPMSNSARANRESGDNHEAMQIRPNEASMTAMCGVAQVWHQKQMNGGMHETSNADELDGANNRGTERGGKTPNKFLNGEYVFERSEVLRYPEYVGVNLDEAIVNGRIALADRYRRTHDVNDLPPKYRGFSRERIDKFIADQDGLVQKFDEYIQSFNGQLRHARIHRTSHLSPLGMGNAVRMDGSIAIAPEFLRQVDILKRAGANDLMVTAELYSDRYGDTISGHLTDEQRRDYVNMVNRFVDIAGDNVIIEIGNETNVTIKNPDGSYSARYINPKDYAEMYCDIASQLKRAHPQLRLAVAGAAFADYDYLSKVMDNIDDSSLVDIISCHPYRGAVDGVSHKPGDYSKTITYHDEEKLLRQLAEQYNAEYRIGEIAYGGGHDGQAQHLAHANLDRDLQHSVNGGIITNIWPRTGLPF